ncbi:hypothetical protein ACGCUQ_00265 [Eubacteriales bacterium KG127]
MFIFAVEHRKIFYVTLNGEDLYDAEKGGFLKSFDEVHIPETDISDFEAGKLKDKTESILDNHFASVRYLDGWKYARRDGEYMVQCQASDGSIFTSNNIFCKVWYKKQGDDFVATGVQIDGQQYQIIQ